MIKLDLQSYAYLKELNKLREQKILELAAIQAAIGAHITQTYGVDLSDFWELDLDHGLLIPNPPPLPVEGVDTE